MPELLSAVAQLLWPLITLVVLLVFRRAIGRVLRTAERRELEVEVGGQRLTMHQLNDQQNEMIQDLQRQLSRLSQQLEESRRDLPQAQQDPYAPLTPGGSGQPSYPAQPGGSGRPVEPGAPGAPPTWWSEPSFGQPDSAGAPQAPAPSGPRAPSNGEPEPSQLDPSEQDVALPAVQAPVGPEPFAVLWVDDQPESHALLVQQLRDNGVRVTAVNTTAETLEEVSQRPYRLIVSDMARKENGRYHADAGITLLRELRDLGVDVPVIVFSSQRGHLQYGALARQSGAVATTTSAYEMFQHFQYFGLL